jgi:Ca2+-binding RTX toxin-like protein
MTLYTLQTGETVPVLATGDDVHVKQNVFLDDPIDGHGTDGHEVIVAGTVDCVGNAIRLGVESGGANSVTVQATGEVYSFDVFAVAMYGTGQQVVNHGLVWGDAGVWFGSESAAPATISSLVNTGTIEASGLGVYHNSEDTLIVNNSGTIRGGETSSSSSFVSQSDSKDLITNSGIMIGSVYLGVGDDLYDGRLGTVDGDVFGGWGNDRLYAGTGNNKLFGSDGTDTLIGGAGADYLSGGTGSDRASYSSATAGVTVSLANPSINKGNAAGDTYNSIENLSGSRFSDILNGNSARNAINGGDGNDVINGYAGSDTLSGGAGNDAFVFNTAIGVKANNVDAITDFNVADDTIRLDNAVFTALTATGTLASTAFRANTTGLAGDSSDRIIYETDTGALYYDADGNGTGSSGIRFATVGPGLGLTNADFVVF